VRILKEFKSLVLEVRILQGLEVEFAEVRILKRLRGLLRHSADMGLRRLVEWELGFWVEALVPLALLRRRQ
jgi:hypothetical protein